MGFDDYETQLLIEAVKKNPILYDTNLPDYKNFQVKRQLWEQFAEDFGMKNGEVILTKWKQLRDNYAKHKKKNTPDAHPYRKWRWASYMTFMDPHLRKPRNITSEGSEPEDSEETSQSCEEPIEVNTGGPQVCVFKRNYPVRKKVCVDSPSSSAVSKNSEKLDMTDYLFLNYAQTLKKLDPRSQILLKLEVAKLFAEAEIGDIDGEKETFNFILKTELEDDTDCVSSIN